MLYPLYRLEGVFVDSNLVWLIYAVIGWTNPTSSYLNEFGGWWVYHRVSLYTGTLAGDYLNFKLPDPDALNQLMAYLNVWTWFGDTIFGIIATSIPGLNVIIGFAILITFILLAPLIVIYLVSLVLLWPIGMLYATFIWTIALIDSFNGVKHYCDSTFAKWGYYGKCF